MDAPARTSGYDLFKLTVSISLLILFLILIVQGVPQSPALISVTPSTATPPPKTTFDQTQTEPVPASQTSLSLTGTLSPIASPTATISPSLTATPLPSPTATATNEITATPTVAASVSDVCGAAMSRSRLRVGAKGTILRRLNFRSSPGIRDNWIRTNILGTSVEVVGGPECLLHFIGAYVWWQIKLPDGQIGWSAESSWGGGFYFIGPVE